MGNNCYVLFYVKGCNEALKQIESELKTIGWNGCYGFNDIIMDGEKLTVRGTTKWKPPNDMFNKWMDEWPSVFVDCYFKEEYLHFSGRWNCEYSEPLLVDFNTTSSRDVRMAQSGLLYKLNTYFSLADHMDDDSMNDYHIENRQLLESQSSVAM